MQASLLVVAVALVVPPSAAAAGVLLVPQQYDTIQDAVDHAGFQDEVIIAGGTYPESVVVSNKNKVHIIGKGKVVIEPPGSSPALTLTDCTLCLVEKVRASGGVPGFLMNGTTTDCEFFKCRSEGSALDGIRIEASHNVLEQCVVEDAARDGISLGGHARSAVDQCLLFKNKVTDAAEAGVLINGSNNTIEETMVTGCTDGFVFDDTTECASNLFVINKAIHPLARG